MNKWLGSGKLTDNPYIKYDNDKATFATFTVMCVRSGKIPEGGQAVDFIDVKASGYLADFVRNYLRKGKKVEVVGPIQSGSYTDKEGRKVYTKTVFAESINFAESKSEEESRQERNQETPPPMGPDYDFMKIPDGIDSELPFN